MVGRSVTLELKSGKTLISAPAYPSATGGRAFGLVLIPSGIALLLLPNRPRLDCRVSGLVLFHEKAKIESIENEGRGVAGKAGRGTRPGHVGQKGRGVITLHGPVRSECVCVCVFSARNSNQSGTIVSDHEVSIESYGKGKIPVNPA